MSDIKVTTKGYLISSGGDLAIVKEAEALAQQLSQKIKLFLKEWFLDQTAGVPYYEYIVGKNYNLSTISSILRSTISSTTGVRTIDIFKARVESTTRTLYVEFAVNQGSVQLVEVLL